MSEPASPRAARRTGCYGALVGDRSDRLEAAHPGTAAFTS
jgi:hypothetical protein